MSDLAIIEQPTNTATPKRDKPFRISKRLRKAIDLLASGECKTQKAAAERVGMHPDSLCRELAKDSKRAYLARVAAQNISRGILRASSRLNELVDAESEHVSANVSMRLLEEGGILQRQQGHSTSVNIVNNVSPGYVVDLTPAIEHKPHDDHTEGRSERKTDDV